MVFGVVPFFPNQEKRMCITNIVQHAVQQIGGNDCMLAWWLQACITFHVSVYSPNDKIFVQIGLFVKCLHVQNDCEHCGFRS